MRAPWLGDVLTDAGLRVATPVGNPTGRGREMDAIYGVVGHDTVTPGWPDLRVAKLLRDGRKGLPGPLSQLGVRPDGTVDWIADGRCNHNGYGTWGNDAIAFEVYCGGGYDRSNPDPWNDRQYETVVVGARAILEHLDLGPSSYWNPRVAGHKETDPDRKVDPYLIDMEQVRREVAEGDDMTPAQARMLEEIHDAFGIQTIDGRGRMQATEGWNLSNYIVKALPARIAKLIPEATVDVDTATLADEIRGALGDDVAGKVADEIKRRL